MKAWTSLATVLLWNVCCHCNAEEHTAPPQHYTKETAPSSIIVTALQRTEDKYSNEASQSQSESQSTKTKLKLLSVLTDIENVTKSVPVFKKKLLSRADRNSKRLILENYLPTELLSVPLKEKALVTTQSSGILNITDRNGAAVSPLWFENLPIYGNYPDVSKNSRPEMLGKNKNVTMSEQSQPKLNRNENYTFLTAFSDNDYNSHIAIVVSSVGTKSPGESKDNENNKQIYQSNEFPVTTEKLMLGNISADKINYQNTSHEIYNPEIATSESQENINEIDNSDKDFSVLSKKSKKSKKTSYKTERSGKTLFLKKQNKIKYTDVTTSPAPEMNTDFENKSYFDSTDETNIEMKFANETTSHSNENSDFVESSVQTENASENDNNNSQLSQESSFSEQDIGNNEEALNKKIQLRQVDPLLSVMTPQLPEITSNLHRCPKLFPLPIPPRREIAPDERAERLNRVFDRFIQFVSIVGQVDSYLTDKARNAIRKLAILYDDDVPRNYRRRFY